MGLNAYLTASKPISWHGPCRSLHHQSASAIADAARSFGSPPSALDDLCAGDLGAVGGQKTQVPFSGTKWARKGGQAVSDPMNEGKRQ